jgi:hypothetical protein
MGYGFLGDGSLGKANNSSNEAATGFGLLDSLTKVASKGAQALPGSKLMGPIGGALAGLGLANDITDMTERGINSENGLNAVGNALSLASLIPGPAGALSAAASGGLAIGSASNDFVSDRGWLGQNVDGSNRSWSDMAADWGTSAEEAVGGGGLGTAAGLAATGVGSLVGMYGTVASAPLVVGDMALDVVKDGAGLAASVGSAGLDLAGDAWDSVWD